MGISINNTVLDQVLQELEDERGIRLLAVIVCGDRYWSDKHFINNIFSKAPANLAIIIEGMAPGADTLAGECTKQRAYLKLLEVPAKWDLFQKRAGVIRNSEMLQELKRFDGDKEVWAFHDNIKESKGTKHMLRIAKKAGIVTYLFTHTGVTVSPLV